MDLRIILFVFSVNIDSAHSYQNDERNLGRFVTGVSSTDTCITKKYLTETVQQLFVNITDALKGHGQANTSMPTRNSYATRNDLEEILKELFVNISSITADSDDGPPEGTLPSDCEDIEDLGYNTTGIYTIYPGAGNQGFSVRCDMDTTMGAWTVIQRRISPSDFYKNWSSYENGFGNLDSNFWLGNRYIHQITSQANYKLRIDLSTEEETAFAEYNEFSLGDTESDYKLYLKGFYGTAGDSLGQQSGMKFSTYDKDNDIAGNNCAVSYTGAWWYDGCHQSNLNGMYDDTRFGKGINWSTWKGYTTSMTTTEMKIRRT